MDIVIITTIAQIVQRLLAHIAKTPSGPFHAKCAENAAITFYGF